jgi:hypothetical protein
MGRFIIGSLRIYIVVWLLKARTVKQEETVVVREPLYNTSVVK